ncbi:tyrosine kinase-like protein 4 [Leptotrombidium deliense]|uniref:Tyrosine kinase-like protein 4 n=1 Tax=Leptotrombidium deliense TaxID=299467 RepID=A0A443RYH2_9ACAR|nr:tyrosine kinase-like protein 4 [Leptotrombidium deliense]
MKANNNGLLVNSLTPIRDAVSHLTRLDDFNVVKLSAGFFSEVFKVTHISTKKVMVLKMNKHPANRSNALREIELLNKLNHPNVVAFMGTVVHEGQLHPLLEYLNYGTLENLIKRFYPVSITATIPSNEDTSILFSNLAKDVAEGMSYLHNHNYMHRDLTSRNVLIRRNADAVKLSSLASLQLTAVIADFGFAIAEPLATDPKLPIVGSPYWLAPECLKDHWSVSK